MAENWQVRGTYFEACNCAVAFSGANFLSAPTEGECKVIVAWHVDEGRYGAVDLMGMNVALFAYSPGHMMQEKWKVALYTDERATQEQAKALTTIFSGQGGGHLAAWAPSSVRFWASSQPPSSTTPRVPAEASVLAALLRPMWRR